MTTPFIDTKANFHGIADPSSDPLQRLKYIWIEKVIHKTALKMDEEKTQAAAATAIIMGGMGGMSIPPPVNVFRADRPYLVLIRDNQTGLILFAGRINDPGVYATEADGPVTPSFEGMPFGMQQGSNGGFGLPPEGPARTTVPGAAMPQTTTSRPGSGNTSTIRQIQEKFPEEYAEIQKLRGSDPAAYRTKLRELQQKLNEAN